VLRCVRRVSFLRGNGKAGAEERHLDAPPQDLGGHVNGFGIVVIDGEAAQLPGETGSFCLEVPQFGSELVAFFFWHSSFPARLSYAFSNKTVHPALQNLKCRLRLVNYPMHSFII
jgi:hypothetical protein